MKRGRVLKSHGKMTDILYWLLALFFLTTSWSCVAFSDELVPLKRLTAGTSAQSTPGHALAMNRHILVSNFGHLASLLWAKLILGRFRDAVLPDFSRFPAGSDD
jgi:hypothetical protein